MEDPIASWESEGGCVSRMPAGHMIGTRNQIAWAVQIRSQVEAEFDRVRNVLEYAAAKRSPENATDIYDIIRILEDKRVQVMENEQASYFIHVWQDPGHLVSQLVIRDSRYDAIKASQTARFAAESARDPKPEYAKRVNSGAWQLEAAGCAIAQDRQ
jgi:hypothetical protein